MVFRWMLVAFIFGLMACGNASQFRAKVVSLERVEAPKPATNSNSAPAPKIERLSQKIDYQNLKAEWQGDDVTLIGNFKLNNEDLGLVEMQGTLRGDEIILIPKNEKLSEKIRAKATCVSEDNACSEFFVDVVAKEDSGKISHDQFVMNRPKATTPAAGNENHSGAPAPAPQKIRDEVEDFKWGAYVGSSDDEIRALFAPQQSTTTTTTSTTGATKPPVSSTMPPSTSPQPLTTPTTVVTAPPTIPPVTPMPIPSTTTTTTVPPRTAPVVGGREENILSEAIGAPNRGRLQNAVDFSVVVSEKASGLALKAPQDLDHFATASMVDLLKELGSFVFQNFSGYVLKIGDLSNRHGGTLAPHLSHQNGLDADIGFMVNNKRSDFTDVVVQQNVNSDFMATENWRLFQKIFSSGKMELIFVHAQIKKALCAEALRTGDLKDQKDQGPAYQLLRRIREEEHHRNHFHLRISCPSTDKRCRQPVYTLKDSGCF